MAYVKNTWVDQDVERPKTYEVTNNQDGSITLTDSFGLVTELGTPVNEVNMNHIEDGIDGCAIRKHNLTETFNLGEWVLGGTGDDEGIYKSLIADNVGNAITDDTAWEKVEMGGGGLEIGDIGFTPLGIDETQNKRRILNGQLIIQDQFKSFTTKLKHAVVLDPSIATTEANWQASVTFSPNGTCDKFVIDDTAGTIRLPKYPDYCSKEYTSMPVVGNGKGLGLTSNPSRPDEDVTLISIGYDQAHYLLGQGLGIQSTNLPYQLNNTYATGDFYAYGIHPNYTKSNVIADLTNSTSEVIAGKWFIQVATGVEESIDVTREIELNNPFCLLDYKYSEYELNNISWLRSNGQYNSKATYPDAYDLLLKIYNGTETKAGVSVKLSTETFADTDFVLNTSNETFRLPLKVALASGKAVVGNGMSIGFTNGSLNAGLRMTGNTSNIGLYDSDYGISLPHTSGSGALSFPASSAIGLTTDGTKSGIELSDANLYLYFYVGETVQNANLINAGRIEEKISALIPENSSLIAGYSMPSNKYINLTLGASGSTYVVPANGWLNIYKSASSGQYIIFDTTSSGGYKIVSASANNSVSLIAPVKKGDVVTITYTATGSTQLFRFIYAQGSESEA